MWGGIHDLETGDRMDLPEFPSYRLPPERFALFQHKGGDDEANRTASGILMTGKGTYAGGGAPRSTGLTAQGRLPASLSWDGFSTALLIEHLGRQVHARFTLDPIGQRQSPVDGAGADRRHPQKLTTTPDKLGTAERHRGRGTS